MEQPVDLPAGRVVLEKPRSADDLISEADFAADERLPYWADLWPAAVVLAEYLEQHPVDPRVADAPRAATGPGARPRALELGCGLGLVTIAAMRAGYAVTATDYYEDATRFTARNALRATGEAPSVRMVDWRALPVDLGHHALVLAADVLYEKPYAPLVAEAIRRTLAPGGRALLADQGRVALASFLDEARLRGLASRVVHHERRPTVPAAPEGSAVHSISIYELTDA